MVTTQGFLSLKNPDGRDGPDRCTGSIKLYLEVHMHAMASLYYIK